MEIIVKVPLLLILTFLSLLSLYAVYTMNVQRNALLIDKTPIFFKSLNKQLKEIPILARMMGHYEKELSLIYGSEYYATLVVTSYAIIIPTISVFIIDCSLLFIHAWYFSILVCTYGLIIPFLSVTNRVLAKARRLRISCIDLYEMIARHLVDDQQIQTAFTLIRGVTSGVTYRIVDNFLLRYTLDINSAYSYFSNVIGDKYAINVARILKSCDERGIPPTRELADCISAARRHYIFTKINIRYLEATKKLIYVLLGIILVCAYMSSSIANNLSISNSYAYLSYIGIVGILTVYTIVLWYERY